MRVAILHQAVPDDASPAERDVLDQVAAVRATLTQLGHEAYPLACTLNLEELRAHLERRCPAVAFNLVEALGGSDRLMVAAPLLLEALQIPYTGSAAEVLALANHKIRAKQWLAVHGIATPELATLDTLALAELPLPERYVVKTIFEHASFGLVDHSVRACGNVDALRGHLEAEQARLGRPVFAERYIEGREFNISLLAGAGGVQVLPAAEIVFENYPPEKPRLVGYAAKWLPDSFEYEHTPRRFDFPAADGPLLTRLSETALRCWKIFGLAGYARVDFRVSAEGEPFVLEVNANPCLAPDAGFAAALNRAGIPFPEAVCEILHAAGS